ncbi:hypothetical protein DEJ28_01240 [Curtobacterium sp. MCPF17_002]|uniref:hypothetical protein n=1 Tax=Curtobacterium sp. MCPF17_002 TaxID=2175645 RepID=UPI000DA6F944|nr:hypothetical protein [Curtobacterium sp. MCPF17_002]WIB77747.1 hypothetical protein DEJ28_01240 [Curtobacterium sp. MCPF17_002]
MWRALDVVARQPVLNAMVLANEMGVEPRNAYPHIVKLVEAGVLVSKNEYRHGVLYQNDDVLQALDAFAVRAGRRG